MATCANLGLCGPIILLSYKVWKRYKEMCFVLDYKQLNATVRESEGVWCACTGAGTDVYLSGIVSSFFWTVTMDGD